MELKPYQQQTINDLDRYLSLVQQKKNFGTAFHEFWTNHPRTPLQPFSGDAIEPYKNNVAKAPHICVKVPTAGGKTFIACNALKVIFDAFRYDREKAVVWLVPSITILDQTIRNLKDPGHPYRQKINSHFGNKVEVFDKAALLQGSGFNSSSVREQLNIFILSFDSLRARNKEDRKVFQENSNLHSFGALLGSEEDITLMKVIQNLNPVVVVDESHNAESELSVEMLINLNPCFILDLTATPRKNSNIISFVDAIELKKENMVKLPVIVYNHHDNSEVINSALQLQRKLELQAIEEQKNGGKYIRPIVLFQAQPRTAEDNTTFEKLKEKLIELKIAPERIKIKTANLNELKAEDLMSPECQVRYIITVNALKEGWDCPFAYILASLSDKSSAVDVEQILGRVLRQPWVSKHNFPLLNLSYVLTASSKFMDTLQNIVRGLNKAGFSEKDYKLIDGEVPAERSSAAISQLSVFTLTDGAPSDDVSMDIDTSRINPITETIPLTSVVNIETAALKQTEEFEKRVHEIETNNDIPLPNELQELVKTYNIKDIFREQALQIMLPQFYLKVASNDIFGDSKRELPLEKENLLEGFPLSKADTNIAFDNISSELYKVDLDESRKDYTPTFVKLDGEVKESILTYILDPLRKESRIRNLSKHILDMLGRMDPIPHKEIEKYVNRILTDFTDEQFHDFANHNYSYIQKIKDKIKSLTDQFSERKFKDFLDTDKVFIKPAYKFPKEIAPGDTSKDITKSLYEKEGSMNSFEERVINDVANLNTIAFWTRNTERKGFCINGFINHYPDFIIQTKSGKTLLLETKGDHLDAGQKIRLGNLWAGKAGNNYRYFMVYEKREVTEAYKLDDFINILRVI
ncbi:MAG: DEAD/DEAH box helicase family protein [Bacteroidales bacterium]|nr:DEAD/DEAH box helicase family protein [Bacteroidales bacterium]